MVEFHPSVISIISSIISVGNFRTKLLQICYYNCTTVCHQGAGCRSQDISSLRGSSEAGHCTEHSRWPG